MRFLQNRKNFGTTLLVEFDCLGVRSFGIQHVLFVGISGINVKKELAFFIPVWFVNLSIKDRAVWG